MTSDAVPAGFDMVLSRDALQHLTFQQIHGALRRFAESDAKWTVIGKAQEPHTGWGEDLIVILFVCDFDLRNYLQQLAARGASYCGCLRVHSVYCLVLQRLK